MQRTQKLSTMDQHHTTLPQCTSQLQDTDQQLTTLQRMAQFIMDLQLTMQTQLLNQTSIGTTITT